MTFTQDFFTSRRNYADGTTYIGQLDRLWYSAADNTIRIGNGLPGGKIVCPLGGGGSPLSTKGDIYTFDTDDAALPVGADGLVLTADSTTPSGLAWKATGSSITGLAVTDINGQDMLTLVDAFRADKILTVTENSIAWHDNSLQGGDWLRIGDAASSGSGYIADFDGTITSATGHCHNVNGNDKDVHVFINSVYAGTVGTFAGTGQQSFTNPTLNLDFNQGDKIRLRAIDGNRGRIQDTVVKLILKWRG